MLFWPQMSSLYDEVADGMTRVATWHFEAEEEPMALTMTQIVQRKKYFLGDRT
jgi:hypothetical protein